MYRPRRGLLIGILLGVSGCAGANHRHTNLVAPTSAERPVGPSLRRGPVDPFVAESHNTPPSGLSRYFPHFPWRTASRNQANPVAPAEKWPAQQVAARSAAVAMADSPRASLPPAPERRRVSARRPSDRNTPLLPKAVVVRAFPETPQDAGTLRASADSPSVSRVVETSAPSPRDHAARRVRADVQPEPIAATPVLDWPIVPAAAPEPAAPESANTPEPPAPEWEPMHPPLEELDPALLASPSPASLLDPTPTPEPKPAPAPALEPAPKPAPEPTPAPALEPAPKPAPEPTPAPASEPKPAIAQEKPAVTTTASVLEPLSPLPASTPAAPNPTPEPTPAAPLAPPAATPPAPDPEPTPAPQPQPSPEPTLTPPTPAPAAEPPVVETKTKTEAAPEPEPEPAPEADATTAPAPTPETTAAPTVDAPQTAPSRPAPDADKPPAPTSAPPPPRRMPAVGLDRAPDRPYDAEVSPTEMVVRTAPESPSAAPMVVPPGPRPAATHHHHHHGESAARPLRTFLSRPFRAFAELPKVEYPGAYYPSGRAPSAALPETAPVKPRGSLTGRFLRKIRSLGSRDESETRIPAAATAPPVVPAPEQIPPQPQPTPAEPEPAPAPTAAPAPAPAG